MEHHHVIFDRHTVRLHRDRAADTLDGVSAILEEASDRLIERLDDLTRSFTLALDIGGRGATASSLQMRGIEVVSSDLSPRMARHVRDRSGSLTVCADEEFLPFAEGSFDLVIASLSLHWVNDLPGTLLQIRKILKPDGLFLASMPVLPTLAPLRAGFEEAELALSGGVSPHVSPFPTLRDCASLLQRAGFALPVVDAEVMDIRYRSGLALFRDLRAAGETNALSLRDRRIPGPALFPVALEGLAEKCRDEEGILSLPLHLAVMSSWAPAPTQPKPLAPGQFTTSLRDALGGNPDQT
ncbi:methyltransferase domain-containing protein [Acetobacter sp.]|jgi:SAM-dependent methyltransferase|uniref:methyltransferase domain-containing protein n=1 Tax=Acetobacter sp. TaxID=440 RepID=UPI0025C1B614|nr:methyltransferase domain-containing protein [Acetobacter sp.]MCH4090460.1 methyltransferase domain-containing protein [Acetobacter sp.]MCI1299154.1 methyltransferase domain-containing protein [Acetobacter sp.]MCI1315701.1 methyltransferase domain-containing protein [Acetobacter sp.]